MDGKDYRICPVCGGSGKILVNKEMQENEEVEKDEWQRHASKGIHKVLVDVNKIR